MVGLDLLGPERVLLFAAASKTELVMQPSPVSVCVVEMRAAWRSRKERRILARERAVKARARLWVAEHAAPAEGQHFARKYCK